MLSITLPPKTNTEQLGEDYKLAGQQITEKLLLSPGSILKRLSIIPPEPKINTV